MKISIISKKIMIMVALPILIICIISGVLTSQMFDTSISSEIEKSLHYSAYMFKLAESSVSKESLNIIIGDFKKENHVDVTIFEYNKRIISSIDGAIGTDMDYNIYNNIKDGSSYFATDANVNGDPYFGYYIPIMENGIYTGSIFTGIPQKEANKTIFRNIIKLISVFFIIGIISIIIVYFINKKIVAPIIKISKSINKMYDNDLNIGIEKYKIVHDESEETCNQIVDLSDHINDIVVGIKNVSGELKYNASILKESSVATSETFDNIFKATEEIAYGVTSQADSITNANHQISEMSEELSGIKNDVKDLHNTTISMNSRKDNAMNTLSELLQVNKHMVNDINSTNHYINNTGKNIDKIRSILDVIRDIASETSLLSLNASIEAARAGEQGRGFNVVAQNIKILADNCAKSLNDIEEVIKEFGDSYNLIITNMSNTMNNMELQNDSLYKTQSEFAHLDKEINKTLEKNANIESLIVNLDSNIKEMVDIISDLSAFSEENSAATQETMSTIQEATNNISQIAEKAKDVDKNADLMNNKVNIFKTK